jgi:hypothetical protein
MLVPICDRIRKLASLLEQDNTPSDFGIGGHRMLGDSNAEAESIKVKKPGIVEEQKLTPTALPPQRRPRKQPGHLNKWNPDTKTGLMKDYMQEYRADGKDKEVNGPKSTYKKKFKVL